MTDALEGLTVIDVTQGPVGGLATMILADFGATVTRLLPPSGDAFADHPAAAMWTRGKDVLPHDPARLAQLVETADVVVWDTFTPQDYEQLAANNRALIGCEISSGIDGLPLYEGVISAKTGRMKTLEGIHPEPGPVFSSVQVLTHATSQNSVSAIMSALIERERSGKGQKVSTQMTRALMPYDMGGSLSLQLQAKNPGKQRVRPDPFKIMPPLNYHPAQCADGKWLQMGNLLAHLQQNFLNATGLTDRAPGPDATSDDVEAFRNALLRRMQDKPRAEWLDRFVTDGGIAAGPYQTAEAALADADLVNNHYVTEGADGSKQLGRVARMVPSQRPAPALPRSGGEPAPPLAGLTVLELSTIIAAPLGASFLADLGARVIKVEPPGGDPFRNMGGLGSIRCNQNKESIGVNLKSPVGQKIVQQLAASADVVIHNFRPGVPEKLGIDYETLSAGNPGLIYLQSNGYGPLGPGAKRPSTHPIPGAAMGGALHQSGGVRTDLIEDLDELREAARRLMRANEVNPDPNTSMVVCASTLLGLVARQRTGHGQQIFVDMFGANAYANFDDCLTYSEKPPRRPLDDKLKGTHPLYSLYPSADGWVFLGMLQQDEWLRFCQAMNTGLAELYPDPFSSSGGLGDRIAELLVGHTSHDLEATLNPLGIGCVDAWDCDMSEFFYRESHEDSTMMQKVNHADIGDYYRHGSMIQFSRSPVTLGAAVKGGSHTRALCSEAGYSDDDITTLYDDGTLWSEPARDR
jgi:crotonobetainyl-CoA:carnitine CoA-transferase CaiB-like acyl-CoA transferase